MKQSIIKGDEKDRCFMCKRWGNIETHHCFKGKNRQISDREGFVVHLCSDCHRKLHGKDGHLMDLYIMKTCQLDYEETHSREEFMKLIGRNYIEEDED